MSKFVNGTNGTFSLEKLPHAIKAILCNCLSHFKSVPCSGITEAYKETFQRVYTAERSFTVVSVMPALQRLLSLIPFADTCIYIENQQCFRPLIINTEIMQPLLVVVMQCSS